MKAIKTLMIAAALASGLGTTIVSAQDLPQPPDTGISARLDAVRAAGMLRVGVQNNDPWLVQNTTGEGDPWYGPAHLLAATLADLLGVKLEYVPTSNETKITLLAANQADMSISALGVTPERLEVVDFVTYSANSTCLVYRKDNPKFANVETVDDLNSPEFDLVYGIGSPEEPYLRSRFPNAKIRGVTVHIDEVISGHADSTPYNRIQALRMMQRLPEMAALPKENNCQGSTEQSTVVGMAIDKNQPEFLAWAQSVADIMRPDLDAEEARAVSLMVQ
jgi:polar amino acid transport system substrate-binding protein